MKKLFFIFLLGYVYQISDAQSISADAAKNFIDSTKTVCGKVADTYLMQNGSLFINFSKPYPKQLFTAIIKAKDLKVFNYDVEKAIINKEICVIGLIKLYEGSPEIYITSPDQLQISK